MKISIYQNSFKNSVNRTNNFKELNHHFGLWPSLTEAQLEVSGFSQGQQESKVDSSNGQQSKSMSSYASYMKTEDFQVCISYFHICSEMVT